MIQNSPDDNPWYRMATLYGDDRDRNRVAWNRYMAEKIDDELRSNLIKTGRYSDEELRPFSPEELPAIQSAFAARSGTSTEIPEIPQRIDFSNIEFDKPFFAQGFVFPTSITFDSATFSGPADFSNATFSGVADFGSATFSGVANFSTAIFSGTTHFRSTTFSDAALFGSANFAGPAYFSNATFSYADPMQRPPRLCADFSSATFSGLAYFSGATFAGTAYFRSATFLACQPLSQYNIARFSSATFSGPAYFSNVTFSGVADFGSATFSDLADFSSRATFARLADFSRATFSGLAHFQGATFGQKSLFVNAKMKSQTSFAEVKFYQPPQFFNAKLHEGTRWPDKDKGWPEPPKDEATARDYLAAYERLKLEMDRMKKHGDELDFFVLELQCRQVILDFWKGLPIWIYGVLCDYGRSFIRPLVFLVTIGIVGAGIIRVHFSGGLSLATGIGGGAFGLSFANTFGILGISRDLISPDVLRKLPGCLKVFLAFQAAFGVGLLFLFGLGIRNRFRMR